MSRPSRHRWWSALLALSAFALMAAEPPPGAPEPATGPAPVAPAPMSPPAPVPAAASASQAAAASAAAPASAAVAQEPEAALEAAPAAGPAAKPDTTSQPTLQASSAAKAPGFDLPERDLPGLLDEIPGDEWLVRQLKGDPNVVVIQFPTLQAQGRTLNRTAALIEKSGASRSHVLPDAELEALIRSGGDTDATFYLGHDYTSPDLARFFNAAREQQVPLDADEQGLRSLLQQIGMLVDDGKGGLAAAGVAALVTFSAPQKSDAQIPADQAMDATRRASILGHELSHGVYFTRPAYREYCHRFWHEQLTNAERGLWRHYLKGLGYDGSNEDLLINETQALLMHTSDRRDFSAQALGISELAFEGMRNRFIMHAAQGGSEAVRPVQ